jgi:hypothetical protein
MAKPAHARLTGYIVLAVMMLALTLLAGALAHATEVQLAGIRLNQHAVDLLDIYGTPDGIVTGEGEEIAAAKAGGGAGGPGATGMAGPGMGMGPGMGAGPAAGGPAMMGGPGMGMGMPGMPGMAGAGAGMPGMPGMAGPGVGSPNGIGAGGPGMPGMGGPGGPGGPGGAAGGAAGAGGVSAAPFPMWGLPVWVTLSAGEVEWIYRKSGVVLGFVLDRDGYIRVIAIAAEDCNYARTAKWAPHKFIKLGDDFKQVVDRYGYPDETMTFDGSGTGEVQPGGGSITFSANGVSRVFSRDMVLRYHESNNIAFTLHDMKVTRIHIWKK